MKNKIYAFIFKLVYMSLCKEMAHAIEECFNFNVSWMHIQLSVDTKGNIYGFYDLGYWNYVVSYYKKEDKLSDSNILTNDKKFKIFSYSGN